MIFWTTIKKELENGHNVSLLYVFESKGSSPGRQGFKMMVSNSGLLNGSIGGGLMEFNLVESAKKLARQSTAKPQIHRLIHRKNKENPSGLICSGEQTVAIYVLTQKDTPWVNAIIESEKNGILLLNESGIQFSPNQSNAEQFSTKISSTSWSLQEDLAYHPSLHIIGGGHVSLALSKIAPELDFQVFVYDDREDINTFLDNQKAKTIYVPNYKDIAQFIPQGARHYVVIMSFMFDTDLLILRELLSQKFNYLGIMGSKQKVKILFQKLKLEGISVQENSKIHAPIGLKISSQTPPEIAISILAEMIKIKNQKP